MKTIDFTTEFYNNARRNARAILDGLNALKAMQPTWNALDLGNTLPLGVGNSEGLNKDDIGAAIFDAADIIEAALAQGARTNLEKLR